MTNQAIPFKCLSLSCDKENRSVLAVYVYAFRYLLITWDKIGGISLFIACVKNSLP
jgi:hypothetical protein